MVIPWLLNRNGQDHAEQQAEETSLPLPIARKGAATRSR
jgi:hypothetical protein